MEGAHGVLMSIYGGSDLGLFEINEAATLVAEAAHPEANIIFGAVIDDTLGDEVKVTVIAAGFDSGQLPYKKVDIRREPAAQSRTTTPASSYSPSPQSSMSPQSRQSQPQQPRPYEPASQYSTPVTSNGSRGSSLDLDDDLDVPDFLKS